MKHTYYNVSLILQVEIAKTIQLFDVSFQYFNDELSLGNNVKTSIDQD